MLGIFYVCNVKTFSMWKLVIKESRWVFEKWICLGKTNQTLLEWSLSHEPPAKLKGGFMPFVTRSEHALTAVFTIFSVSSIFRPLLG